MTYQDILATHEALNRRREKAEQLVEKIQCKFKSNNNLFHDKPISVFCAGSLARKDVGDLSDMDLFILSSEDNSKRSRLEEVEIIAALIKLNRDMGFNSFSNDGEYLKVYSEQEMIKALGAPRDDAENLFTARMLLLLESCPVCNTSQYKQFLNKTIEHYFRDSRGRKSFRPLFLLNDMLRWWRTVCLNYELVRDDPKRPWKKKNINLKFSRMLTVFGSVLPLIATPMKHEDDLREITGLTPLERFALGLDRLEDETFEEKYKHFLNNYEQFLVWKEQLGDNLQISNPDLDSKSREIANMFSDFIFCALSHKKIDSRLRKYLVL